MFLDNGNISLHDDRWYTKPWGVNGGGVGTRSTKTLVRHSISQLCPPRQILQSKEDFVQVRSLKCIMMWIELFLRSMQAMFWNGSPGEASDIATKSENLLINESCIRWRIVSHVLSLPAKIADVFEVEILYREIPNW